MEMWNTAAIVYPVEYYPMLYPLFEWVGCLHCSVTLKKDVAVKSLEKGNLWFLLVWDVNLTTHPFMEWKMGFLGYFCYMLQNVWSCFFFSHDKLRFIYGFQSIKTMAEKVLIC